MPTDVPAAAASPWQRLRRLPGRAAWLRVPGSEAVARLWLDEHQLVQESVRFHTQDVRRFDYADIQAIQVRRTKRGLTYNAVLGVILVLIGLVCLTSDDPTGHRLTIGAYVAAPFALLLVVNILLGPTCRAVLTTALGPQALLSLNRLPTARRALEQIAARVESVQGVLTPDEAARQVDRARSNPPAAQVAPTASAKTYPGYDY